MGNEPAEVRWVGVHPGGVGGWYGCGGLADVGSVWGANVVGFVGGYVETSRDVGSDPMVACFGGAGARGAEVLVGAVLAS